MRRMLRHFINLQVQSSAVVLKLPLNERERSVNVDTNAHAAVADTQDGGGSWIHINVSITLRNLGAIPGQIRSLCVHVVIAAYPSLRTYCAFRNDNLPSTKHSHASERVHAHAHARPVPLRNTAREPRRPH